MAVEGANGEFMLLRYADDARLYVPLARLDLVQKYQSLGGVEPQLDRLGTTVWEARKTRVQKSVSDMAEQLLALYAERKTAPGHAFPPDSNWQREFEDAFEFEETPDQQRAIADVKRDMESTLPMDRLLCGDVGYGKTEVAMRAAFKAVARFEASGRARADDGAGVPALSKRFGGASRRFRCGSKCSAASARRKSRRKFWRNWKRGRWTS